MRLSIPSGNSSIRSLAFMKINPSLGDASSIPSELVFVTNTKLSFQFIKLGVKTLVPNSAGILDNPVNKFY